MNQNQINRKEMQEAVINYLDKNVQKWSPIPKVGEFKNELETVHQQINAAQEAQQAAQVTMGKSKNELKRTIAEKADILNDILEAYASITGHVDLESRMAASFSELYTLKNTEFIPRVQEIIEEAEKNIEVLTTEYGMTEAQITDLKNNTDQFLTMQGQPRAYKIASTQATKQLEQLFSDANTILSDRLDKVLKLFKRRDYNFYNGYLAARTIVDD
ncbi:MAG: hypothetical protein GVY19_09820 [Bacteroidetes bacterium]|jgi:archaellum component FlaC|nr:hypothetical protein [Bacteroidota bacterium]